MIPESMYETGKMNNGEGNGSKKVSEDAKIISQEKLAPGIYSMWIETNAAAYAKAGQFISVYTKDASKLLPRPISICEMDSSVIRIVYRVAGDGTKEFSSYEAGDTVKIMGPLGNGFAQRVEELINESHLNFAEVINNRIRLKEGVKALLIGGGIGIPPMLGLAKSLGGDVDIVAGYRNSGELFLTSELSENGRLYIATDDGSFGTKGTVIDAIEENKVRADVIFACGPKPMLRGVKTLAESWNVPAFISMEERMACGVGACLGCVCQTKNIDDHSKVKNKRVCVDGPVFEVAEVEL